MSLFCLCTAKVVVEKGFKIGIQDLNILLDQPGDCYAGIITPEIAMRCEKTGMVQFLGSAPNRGDNLKAGDQAYRHYPNVDIFRCLECGGVVAK